MDEQEWLEQLKESLDYTMGNTPTHKKALDLLRRAANMVTEKMLAEGGIEQNAAKMLDEDIALIREALFSALCRVHALHHPLHNFTDTHMRKTR